MTEKDMEFKEKDREPKWYENIVELDDDGEVISYGTEEDYDLHSAEVQDGQGYYNEWGRYVSYHKPSLDSDD